MNNNGIDMQDDEIDLLELLHHFVRKWWLFLVGGAVGGVVFFLVTSFLITPLYESSATIYILSKTTSITAALDMTTGEKLAEDFQIIATSNPVLDGAAEQIKKDTGKEITREQMKKIVTVSDNATRLLVITATSDNPETSALVANAVAQQTSEKMAEITKTDAPTTVERAEAAKKPVTPNVLKDTAIGVIVGVGVIGLILLVNFLMNDRIISEADVEKYLGIPTLAVLPDKDPCETDKRRKSRA